MLFLSALLPGFVVVSAAVTPQFVILGATFLFCEAAVYTCVALVAVRLRPLLPAPRAVRITNITIGVTLLAVASCIAFAHFTSSEPVLSVIVEPTATGTPQPEDV